MMDNFKHREKILDLMEKNLEIRLSIETRVDSYDPFNKLIKLVKKILYGNSRKFKAKNTRCNQPRQ